MEATIKDELKSLSQKHLSINLGMFAAVILLVAAFGYSMYRINMTYEKALTHFQDDEKAFNIRLDTMEKTQAVIAKSLETLSNNQLEIANSISKRDKTTATAVKKATDPSLDEKQVAALAQTHFGLSYSPYLTNVSGTWFVGFHKEDVQMFVANKLNLDNANSKITDLNRLYSLEQDKSKLFAQSATDYKESLTQCRTTLDDAKKVAKLTKKQQFFGAVKRWGTYAVITLVAYEAGVHK